jgi:hypothetical protein
LKILYHIFLYISMRLRQLENIFKKGIDKNSKAWYTCKAFYFTPLKITY